MHFLFYFPSHFLLLPFLPAALPSLATCPGLSPALSSPRSRSRPGVLCGNLVPLFSLPRLHPGGGRDISRGVSQLTRRLGGAENGRTAPEARPNPARRV